jgi:hypothetical protein
VTPPPPKLCSGGVHTHTHILYMYTNTLFGASFCMIPGLTIMSYRATTTPHVLISWGPSSGVCCCA